MPLEVLTTYTEVDPNNRYSATSTKLTITGLKKNETAYVYDDKGVGNVNEDFTFFFEGQVDSFSADGTPMGMVSLSNDLNDFASLVANNKDAIHTRFWAIAGTDRIDLFELDGGTSYADTGTVISIGTPYWFDLIRDESVGSFGDITLIVYDDAAKGAGDIVDTLNVVLHTSKKDYRYVHVSMGHNSAQNRTTSGWVQNLDLNEEVPDTTPPTDGVLTATGSSETTIDLTWTEATDDVALHPTTPYKLARATGTTPPADCSSTIYTGDDLLFNDTGLTAGTDYAYRLCAVDSSDNESAGVTDTAHTDSTKNTFIASAIRDIEKVKVTKDNVITKVTKDGQKIKIIRRKI